MAEKDHPSSIVHLDLSSPKTGSGELLPLTAKVGGPWQALGQGVLGGEDWGCSWLARLGGIWVNLPFTACSGFSRICLLDSCDPEVMS